MRPKFPLLLILAFASGCAIQPNARPDIYLIFFDTNSAALSPAGSEAVATAATAIRLKHPAHIVIAGPKTTDGAGFDTKLAGPRFIAVEQALIADGVGHELLSRAELNDQEAAIGASGNARVEVRLLKN